MPDKNSFSFDLIKTLDTFGMIDYKSAMNFRKLNMTDLTWLNKILFHLILFEVDIWQFSQTQIMNLQLDI